MRSKITSLRNFSNENIKNITLKKSHITGCIKDIDDSFFYKCIFENVTFKGCIWNVIFRDCKFINSDFERVICTKVSFFESNLTGANFRESRLRIVSFREANLKFADFTKSQFLQITIERASLYGTILNGVDLSQLTHCSGALNLDKSITA